MNMTIGGANKTGWTHKLIKNVAVEMAEAMYEALASKGDPAANVWYQQNKDRAAYVESTWPTLVVQARATLAAMLTREYPQRMKDEIYDALISDNTMREGRNRGERRVLQNYSKRMIKNARPRA